jgi:hypothetical protein
LGSRVLTSIVQLGQTRDLIEAHDVDRVSERAAVGVHGPRPRSITIIIREFMRRGVVVRTAINGLTFDGATKDRMQKVVRDALIALMAATAEAQAEATREAQKAGIAYAKANAPHAYRLTCQRLQRSCSLSRQSKFNGLSSQSKQLPIFASAKLCSFWEISRPHGYISLSLSSLSLSE